jgi:hypothetical protein
VSREISIQAGKEKNTDASSRIVHNNLSRGETVSAIDF